MICPECGRELVRRRGKHGEFMGCRGFPLCDYTRSTPENDAARDKAMKEIEKMGTEFLKDHGRGRWGE
jgi:DNA topoisomerase-1